MNKYIGLIGFMGVGRQSLTQIPGTLSNAPISDFISVEEPFIEKCKDIKIYTEQLHQYKLEPIPDLNFADMYPKSFSCEPIIDVDENSAYPRVRTVYNLGRKRKCGPYYKYIKRLNNRDKLYEKKRRLGRHL